MRDGLKKNQYLWNEIYEFITVKRLFALTFCLIYIIGSTQARNDNYYFWTMDIDKGLSNSNITSILLDSKGILWVGTAFGLNRYDRHEMKNYFKKEEDPCSLPGNFISFVVEGPQNSIWVSTSYGLAQYDKVLDGFKTITNEPMTVYSAYATDKELWFGGTQTLYQYDLEHDFFKKITLKRKDNTAFHITHIFHQKKDVLTLICQDSEIWEYNYRSNRFYPSVYRTLSGNITAAYLDNNQNLYISFYRKGLAVFDRYGNLKKEFTTENSALTNNLIIDILEKDGDLWLATDGGGINILHLDTPYSISSLIHIPGESRSLPDNAIRCLYKDRQQNIWAGSVRAGLFEIKKTSIQTYGEVPQDNPYGVTSRAVNSLCKDKQGFIWVGTDGGGVNRFDPATQTFKHFVSTHNQKVISIVDYSSTELLISLYNNGVYRFNKATGRYTPFVLVNEQISHGEYYSRYLEQIFRVSDECFLFLGQTPYVYRKSTQSFSILKNREHPLGIPGLRMISQKESIVYLLSGNSLLSADLKTDSLSLLFTQSGQEAIEVAGQDRNGRFWMGTNRGLRVLDLHTRTYEKIQTSLFERVSAVVIEKDNIWIGAQNGLFSYDTRTKKFSTWQESDGYTANELSNAYAIPDSTPYLYIGGNHGLVQIRKSIASISNTLFQIELADVMLDKVSYWRQLEKEAPNYRKLSIPWDYKSLKIKIVSIEQDLFKKRLFRYNIFKFTAQGGESKKIESYSPTLDLDLLSPGDYAIQVSCYTNNGEWSKPQQVLQLSVTPPWYKDYRIILLLVFFLLILLIWQTIAIVRRKEEKMKWKMGEMIQQTNQEKIQFLINISHELRTPLTLIYTPLKKVIDKIDSEIVAPEDWRNIRGQLINVHKSANRMRDIINMTLDVNRISDQENALQSYPHMLNEWIYSVSEEFKYELERKQISLVYQLDESIGTVCFDDHKCESVLSNMLMNALKFTPEESRIILSSSIVNNSVRISVSDQGIGLKQVDPQQLFSRFYQGKHNKGGSGIGLSYAKTIIQKHGGIIGAFNNPDRGATFYFELPLTIQEDSKAPEVETKTLVTETFDTTPYSVIIAEDNTDLRRFLAEALKSSFRVIYTAPNGKEAWGIIAEKLPDIIISDVMMPLVDGYELCRKIKSESKTNHIPVILLTARGDTDSSTAGYKLGADAYVSKPFDMEFLQTLIRNLLQNRAKMKARYKDLLFRGADEMAEKSMVNSDEEFLLKFNKLVLDHLSSKELDIKFITEQMNMSRSPLYAKLKGLTDMGVNDYINHLRVEKASELLLQAKHLSIADISIEVGFEYQRYFSTLFKQIKGMTPTQYRQQDNLSTENRIDQDGSGN